MGVVVQQVSLGATTRSRFSKLWRRNCLVTSCFIVLLKWLQNTMAPIREKVEDPQK